MAFGAGHQFADSPRRLPDPNPEFEKSAQEIAFPEWEMAFPACRCKIPTADEATRSAFLERLVMVVPASSYALRQS
jgi:hypothetical protein